MTRTSRVLLLAAGAWALASPSMALTDIPGRSFNLFQSGYAENATITGSFIGADLDGNGLLIHFPSEDVPFPIEHLELTSLSVHFSGNSLSPAFDLSLDDVFGFIFEIDSAYLGDGPAFEPTLNVNLTEGIGIIGAQHFYTSGLGPNSFIGGFVGGHIEFGNFNELGERALDESPNLVQVTLVPEPAAFAILLTATAAILNFGRAPWRRGRW